MACIHYTVPVLIGLLPLSVITERDLTLTYALSFSVVTGHRSPSSSVLCYRLHFPLAVPEACVHPLGYLDLDIYPFCHIIVVSYYQK